MRISLKSDTSLDVENDPNIIYSILLKYFSVAPSCLPLADFYSTLPMHGESAVDYWIRINKAADLADVDRVELWTFSMKRWLTCS